MKHRRRIDVVLSPEYLDALDTHTLEELGEMRVLVDDLENQLSFYRRVLHGRMDVLRFEQRRRRGEDSRSIIEALPELLAIGNQEGNGNGNGNALDRLHADFAPELPEVERRYTSVMNDDILTRLPDLDDDDLTLALEAFGALEEKLSGQRNALHEIHDALVTEIAGRHVASDPA
ncbi:MAG: hypothetical protein HKN46_03335 [Acidimicrobiia bacterium]|nr:hypothetical protein [Acidimicrobiia bacterium]